MADVDRALPQDALLVTDRAFMRSYDGSAAIYTAWLASLRLLGFRVAVVSFNQALLRWTDDELAQLAAAADSVLILDAYRTTAEAALIKAERVIWNIVTGCRYSPHLLGGRHAASNAERLRVFLARRDFRVVVVNKTTSVRLLGKALDTLTGCKLLDVHDNLPRRAKLTRMAALRLIPSNPGLARLMRIEELGDVLGWASENRMMHEEVRQLRGFDRVLFPDEDEAGAFISAGLDPLVAHVIPWPMVKNERVPERTGAFQLGFLGSAQLFNFEAVDFLATQVLPRLRRDHPNLRVLIAGSIVPSARRILRQAGIELIPWVEHIIDFYRQVDVVVVPLLSGTGVSVKTIEAAAYGSAIVTTAVGLRGLALRHDREVLVAEGGEGFASAISRLLNDPELRRKLGAAAANAAALHHSLAAFSSATAALIPDAVPPADVSKGSP